MSEKAIEKKLDKIIEKLDKIIVLLGLLKQTAPDGHTDDVGKQIRKALSEDRPAKPYAGLEVDIE